MKSLPYNDGGVCKAAPENSSSSFFVASAWIEIEFGSPKSGQMSLLLHDHGGGFDITDTVSITLQRERAWSSCETVIWLLRRPDMVPGPVKGV